jgi:hypothetical protein
MLPMIVVGIVMDILYPDCEAILIRLQSDDRVETLREQHLARIGLEQDARERIGISNAYF